MKPFSQMYSEVVIHGEKVGRTIGFPTANLALQLNESHLKPGVYLSQSWLEDQGHRYYSLTYFGPRYIFGEKVNSFETYIYDFDQEIYGQTLHVELLSFMRKPQKVQGLDELKKLLEQDKKNGKKLINDLKK